MNIQSRIRTTYSLKKKDFNERTQLFLLGLPFIILIFVFSYMPLFGWILAFFDYKPGIPLTHTPFVGLKYFKMILADSGDLLASLRNTFAFYFFNLLATPLPVVFAILLNEVRKPFIKKTVQTFTTLPNFISWIIIYSLSFAMFSSEGMLNQFLMNLGLINEPVNVLGNDNIVWVFQTLLNIWKSLGWGAIIYLSAISGIDSELYDAANVDGAGLLQRILHITVPGIAPTFLVMLILSISNMLSVGFDQYLVFYNGLVADKISVIDIYVYRLGILSTNFSYATAIGMAKTVVSIVLLFIANGMSKKIRGNGIL